MGFICNISIVKEIQEYLATSYIFMLWRTITDRAIPVLPLHSDDD